MARVMPQHTFLRGFSRQGWLGTGVAEAPLPQFFHQFLAREITPNNMLIQVFISVHLFYYLL